MMGPSSSSRQIRLFDAEVIEQPELDPASMSPINAEIAWLKKSARQNVEKQNRPRRAVPAGKSRSDRHFERSEVLDTQLISDRVAAVCYVGFIAIALLVLAERFQKCQQPSTQQQSTRLTERRP